MKRTSPSEVAGERFDVIIIGAGINGAGVARDAALRGLRVLLVDQADIAAGTTSRSTRLIHGGLRYLEYGEVDLVRESLRERERLLRLAPHLVRPLPMIIPVYDTGRRGRWSIKAGMIAYDLLSFDKSLNRHRMLSVTETLRRVPGLRREGLRGAAVYYDAQVEYAERLAVENSLSAADHGARIMTHARVDGLIGANERVRGVRLTDLLGDGTYEVESEVTVNAAGPWVDAVLGTMSEGRPRLIGGTKGSHIIVDPFESAPSCALYVEAERDGRPFFIIPWDEKYLIGTTDTHYTGDPGAAEADAADIEYLLAETNRVLPAAHLTTSAIRYTYAGVRPLPLVERRAESGITRRHFVRDHAPQHAGLLSIIGGKLTTYRNLAEETVDHVGRLLGKRILPCRTASVPLPGAQTGDFCAFGRSFIASAPLPGNAGERLLRVYGTRAQKVLDVAGENETLRAPLCAGTNALSAEVLFAFREEMAGTLADCLLRRMMIDPDVPGAEHAAGEITRAHLGWSETRIAREIDAYHEELKKYGPRIAAATKGMPTAPRFEPFTVEERHRR